MTALFHGTSVSSRNCTSWQRYLSELQELRMFLLNSGYCPNADSIVTPRVHNYSMHGGRCAYASRIEASEDGVVDDSITKLRSFRRFFLAFIKPWLMAWIAMCLACLRTASITSSSPAAIEAAKVSIELVICSRSSCTDPANPEDVALLA